MGQQITAFFLALAGIWRTLHALIVVLVFTVLAPVIAVIVWPVYERAGIGVSVFAFALIV